MPSLYSHRVLSAILILSLQDEFARAQVGKGYPRPIEPLRFYLVGTYQGVNLQRFPEPVRLLIQTNADGYYLFFGQERVDERTKRNMFLQDGDYQVRVAMSPRPVVGVAPLYFAEACRISMESRWNRQLSLLQEFQL